MTTIKDIAARLGLSPSTVSIVLKGNGDRRKIKKETQQRILKAAREMGYKPKILRGSLSAKANISLYWVSDNRIHLLSRFLKGLQTAIMENNYQFQLSIVPYENNHLQDVLTNESVLTTNAIIICNPSETDMEYLEANGRSLPQYFYLKPAYTANYANALAWTGRWQEALELAEALEVSRQTIGSLENGRYNPSILLAFKLSRYFGVPIEEIFIYEEELP